MLSSCLLCVLLSAVFLHWDVNGAAEWNYEKQGPESWPKMFPTCVGLRQSPINIVRSKAVYKKELKPFKILSSSSKADFTVSNDGHKVSIKFPLQKFTVTFGSEFNYEVNSLHWHWGKDNGEGSEHHFNGKSGPLELHIVTFNTRLYKTFEDAAGQPNGLAVFGLMYEVRNPKTTDLTLAGITNSFASIRKCSACATGGAAISTSIKSFELADLLPNSLSKYYRYTGSLTTPPCTENVMWTVLEEVQPISQTHMNQFRKLEFPNGEPMLDNYRPPQVLNPSMPIGDGEREILRSFD